MTDRRRLMTNVLSLLTTQGVSYVLPLITLPYLVRVLGAEKFGLIAFAQGVIQYFIVISDYGFNLSATREVALNCNDPVRLGGLTSAVILIKISFAAAGLIILMALSINVPMFNAHWPLFAAFYFGVVGATLYPIWLFQGLQWMRQMAWMTIGGRVFTTVAIFVLVRNQSDYTLAAWLLAVPLLIASVPAWIVIIRSRKVAWTRPKIGVVWAQLKAGFPLFLSTIGINIYNGSGVIALGLISGPAAVGYFSAAYKLTSALIGLMSPIVQAVYPHISVLAKESWGDAWTFIKRLFIPMFLGFFLVSFGVYVFSGPLVNLLFGTAFAESQVVLRILSITIVLIAVSNILGTLTMLPFGMNKTFAAILLIGTCVNLLIVVPLVTQWSYVGAALTMVATESVIVFLLAIFVRLYCRNKLLV